MQIICKDRISKSSPRGIPCCASSRSYFVHQSVFVSIKSRHNLHTRRQRISLFPGNWESTDNNMSSGHSYITSLKSPPFLFPENVAPIIDVKLSKLAKYLLCYLKENLEYILILRVPLPFIYSTRTSSPLCFVRTYNIFFVETLRGMDEATLFH